MIRNGDISGNETGIEVDGNGTDVTITANAIHDNDRMIVNDLVANNDRGANCVVAYHVVGPMLVTTTGSGATGLHRSTMDMTAVRSRSTGART